LVTAHNLFYFQELMGGMRAAIAENRFDDFKTKFEIDQAEGDLPEID